MVKRGKSAKYGNSNIQIIKSGQARGYCHFDFSKHYFVSENFVSDERNLQKGDVLINSTGVGTAGRVTLFNLDGEYVVDSHVTIVRPNTEKVLPKYMLYALADIGFKNIEAMANGQSGQIELALNTVCGIKIPLPSLEIQQKIVAEIEQIENKEQFVSAQITEHYYTIEHIFDPISASHTELLGKLAECNPPKVDIPNDTLISFVEMAAVSNNGHIVSAVDRPMLEVRKGSYTYFQENDIIIAKITPCMENGKCALAMGLTNGIGMGSSEFHVFRCGAEILPKYLFGYLNRQVIRQEAEKVMTGSSGHRRVPIGFYQQLLIPVLPLSDQQKIATQIQQAEDQITQLDARLSALKAKKESVLKKYL